MKFKNLSDDDNARIHERLKQLGVSPDYWTFWNANGLQLDGDYTLAELKAFAQIMEELQAASRQPPGD